MSLKASTRRPRRRSTPESRARRSCRTDSRPCECQSDADSEPRFAARSRSARCPADRGAGRPGRAPATPRSAPRPRRPGRGRTRRSDSRRRAGAAGAAAISRVTSCRPSLAAEQRDRRLVIAHLGLQRRPRAVDHVRRVRDDHVERAGDAVEQIGRATNVDAIADAVPRGVAPGDVQRRPRDVGGDDRGVGALARDAPPRRSRSRCRRRRSSAAPARSGNSSCDRFDDQLGFRPRNQHGRRDLELEPPELADADDVGERLAGDAAGDERVVARREAVGRRLARVGQKRSRRPSRARAARAAARRDPLRSA